jgi:hypothetical protein
VLFQQGEWALARLWRLRRRDTTKALADVADEKLFDNWFDPIETELRTNVSGFIGTMMEEGRIKQRNPYLERAHPTSQAAVQSSKWGL